MRILLALGLMSSAAAMAAGDAARAILENRCLNCHGKAQTSGLDLRQMETMVRGGKRGPAIVPGHADQSLLYQAVARTGDLQMPPGKPLAAEEIAAIGAWINEGAHSDRAAVPEPAWWAFKKVVRPAVPAVEPAVSVANPVDAFVLSKLHQNGLQPVAAADKRTLVRRAYYDLHGLPPTPAQVAEFVNDSSPGAYEKLIDRLLASPRYGERWGRHWLDVVRYADTGGFETDMYYANAWRYRDYVIKSLNDDKPYDPSYRSRSPATSSGPTISTWSAVTVFPRRSSNTWKPALEPRSIRSARPITRPRSTASNCDTNGSPMRSILRARRSLG